MQGFRSGMDDEAPFARGANGPLEWTNLPAEGHADWYGEGMTNTIREAEVRVDPQLVRADGWDKIQGLRHGFSGRAGGVSEVYSAGGNGELNLGFTAEDDAARVRENRARVLRAVGGEAWRWEEIALVRQIHSAEVRVVSAGERLTDAEGRARYEGDGLITAALGVMLGVQAADCVPVLVADVRRRTAGAFHAGWRGTAAGIVRVGIAAMRREFGSEPQDLMVAIGPSIGQCCYAVGGELADAFAGAFAYGRELFEERGGKVYLDLWEANRRQALEAGVAPERITVVGECTACCRVGGERAYFSHRADAGRTGRGMGLVAWE
jgi:YfiH family protein